MRPTRLEDTTKNLSVTTTTWSLEKTVKALEMKQVVKSKNRYVYPGYLQLDTTPFTFQITSLTVLIRVFTSS